MHQLDVRTRQQTLREIAPAVAVGRVAEIEPGKVQQVEARQYHGARALCGSNFCRALELRAVLQGIEGWPAVRAGCVASSAAISGKQRVRSRPRRDCRRTVPALTKAMTRYPSSFGS